MRKQTIPLAEWKSRIAETLNGIWDVRIESPGAKGAGHPRIHFSREAFSASAWVRLQPRLRQEDVEPMASANPADDAVILLTPQVSRRVGEQLIQKNIQFLDGDGNAYINLPGLYLCKIGQKKRSSEPHSSSAGKLMRAFNATGLKLIFYLLEDPGRVRNTYREMSTGTGISLGSVVGIFSDLERLGFIVKRAGTPPLLVDRRKLLDRWVQAYRERLYPKLAVGRYQTMPPENWRKIAFSSGEACWGGEVAAERLTGALVAAQGMLYVGTDHNLLLAKNRLRPGNGENAVQLVEVFWLTNTPKETAPPLVVYADLVDSFNSRNREAAARIYNEFLKPVIENA